MTVKDTPKHERQDNRAHMAALLCLLRAHCLKAPQSAPKSWMMDGPWLFVQSTLDSISRKRWLVAWLSCQTIDLPVNMLRFRVVHRSFLSHTSGDMKHPVIIRLWTFKPLTRPRLGSWVFNLLRLPSWTRLCLEFFHSRVPSDKTAASARTFSFHILSRSIRTTDFIANSHSLHHIPFLFSTSSTIESHQYQISIPSF